MATLERYECDVCGKHYGNAGHLNRHKRVHTNERPYKCNQCDKSFMRKDHLNDHTFTHSAHRPFSCNQCNKKFYTKQKLNRHKILHDRPKPYQCEHCNEAFVKKNQLAVHRVTHTGTQPFPCPEPNCDKGFAVPSALKRHQERRHSLSTFLCIEPGCNAEPFTKFSMLQRHLKLHRPKNPHACDGCGKRFRNASSLSKHRPTHQLPVADRMTHKCRFPGCNAAYTSSGNLGTHVRSQHLNRRAYVCALCTSRFSVKSSYQRHLRNVHGDDDQSQKQRFSCEECNINLPSRAALKRHIRIQHGQSIGPNEVPCFPQGKSLVNEEAQSNKAFSPSQPIGGRGKLEAEEGDDVFAAQTLKGEAKEISVDKCVLIQTKREHELTPTDRYSEASRRKFGVVDSDIREEHDSQGKRRRLVGRSDAHQSLTEGIGPIVQPLNSGRDQEYRIDRAIHATVA